MLLLASLKTWIVGCEELWINFGKVVSFQKTYSKGQVSIWGFIKTISFSYLSTIGICTNWLNLFYFVDLWEVATLLVVARNVQVLEMNFLH